MNIILKKLFIIVTVIYISSCMNTRNTYEKFELLPYGISVKEGKKILKINNITIIDEELGEYSNGEGLCILTTRGALLNNYCYIEYHFMGDRLIQGFYRFNALGYDYDYAENEIEELLQFFINYFMEQFDPKTNIYTYEDFYMWELDNKMKIVITVISDNSFVIENIGIDYLINTANR